MRVKFGADGANVSRDEPSMEYKTGEGPASPWITAEMEPTPA